jgi:hypothetical protein
MRLPLSAIFCILAYWTLAGLGMDHFADDPGLGWHLLTGELVASSGAPPQIDPFLASPTPRRWIADQWLSDLLMSTLWQWGGGERGMALLYAAGVSIFLIMFMGITFSAAKARSGSPLLAGLAALCALKLSTVHFILRPVVIGLGFFAFVSWIVWGVVKRVRREGDIQIREVAALVPLTAVWANLHPSFGLGIIMVGLATLGLLYDTVVIERRPFVARPFLILASTCALMILATLLNPYGFDLVRHVVELVRDDYFMNLNDEWKPIDLRGPEGTLFLQTAAVLLIGAFLTPRREGVGAVTEPLIIGFFAWSTLSSVRFLPYYAIAAAPLVAQSIARIASCEPFMRLAPYRRMLDLLAALDRRERLAMPLYACILVGIVCFPLIDAATRGSVFPYRGPFGPSRSTYPYDGVAALNELILQESLSQPVAVAATPNWGGFLALHGAGRFKPVIDDRNSLLGAAAYKDFISSTTVGGDTAGYLKRTGARFLLLRNNEPLAIYLRDSRKLPERWHGEVSAIFETLP